MREFGETATRMIDPACGSGHFLLGGFARTARWDGFTKDELAWLAARAGLPERLALGAARETVEAFREMWGKERGHLPLRDEIAEVIDRQLGIVPLAGSG